ncbi:hypothetical protein SISSUDRAFT_1020379 [Sistotremastrum suecicum HHB10207 ss-3]|uniref:BTB domain-containing protein n=1 Tax=Sistotremastrum suecicum HHB10207 ss-3 TaxID=1314776 RepID=A0A166E9K8_9AGAM|nr:hypothetical protein SISSUDRAFT_1020379 [Sistotremastrum suecicum HHB10207 ss-3]
MPDANSSERDSVHEYLSFPDGDLIIQTSDKHDFKVHKLVMSLASVVFLDMASLDDVNAERMEIDAVPTVKFVETAAVMDILLRYIYPAVKPTLTSLEVIISALAAADKYIMTTVMKDLECVILTGNFVEKEPLRIYMLAKRFSLANLERAAFKGAVYSSTTDLTPYQVSTESAWFSFEEFYKLKFFAGQRIQKCKVVIYRETFRLHERVCDCIRRDREAHSQAIEENPEEYRGDYVSEDEDSSTRTCSAWTKFADLACSQLDRDPTQDIFSIDIRRKVLQDAKCGDALASVLNESEFGRIARIRKLLDGIPWEYEEQYETLIKKGQKEHLPTMTTATTS